MSIGRRMILILLGAFFIVWVLATSFTVYNVRSTIEDSLDEQLESGANIIWERTVEAIKLEKDLGTSLESVRSVYRRFDSLAYQIWDGDTLLNKSDNAPDTRMSFERPGFRDGRMNDANWRFYYRVDDIDGLDVIVGVADNFSGRAAAIVAISTTWPILLALPFIGLAIFFGVRRGLRPLRELESQIIARSPTQMSPIDDESVPLEVKGIVRSLNSLLHRLEDAIEGERRFTSNASHELRTPLAAIEVQSQVALRSEDEAERKKALDQISRSVDRATRLVSQLLTMARLDPETAASLHHELDLRRIVEEEVANASQSALDKKIDIGMDAPESGLIMGDPDALSILARNLLDNAIRYTPEGGEVTAAIRNAGGHVFLSVVDNGPGIPAEERSKIFDRFYRIAGSKSSGAGLGLSIVQRIAELHHAEIRLSENPAGQGLVASVAFPQSSPATGKD